MTTSRQVSVTTPPDAPWHGVSAEEAARRLGVDVSTGLDKAEAESRLAKDGPNRLTGTKKESPLRAFLRQYEDFMQWASWWPRS